MGYNHIFDKNFQPQQHIFDRNKGETHLSYASESPRRHARFSRADVIVCDALADMKGEDHLQV